MAHLMKFNRSAAPKILGHCSRDKSKFGKFLKYNTNSEIDPKKTKLNRRYKFDDELSAEERLKKRLSEVKVFNRADVVVMCDWVVTVPGDIENNLDAQLKYLVIANNFLRERYGKKNHISSAFHFDETTPHLHFCFVPVIEEKGLEKVNAKKLINKAELKRFHTELDREFERVYKKPNLALNGATKGGNKSIEELKELTEIKKQIDFYGGFLKMFKELKEKEYLLSQESIVKLEEIEEDFEEDDEWEM